MTDDNGSGQKALPAAFISAAGKQIPYNTDEGRQGYQNLRNNAAQGYSTKAAAHKEDIEDKLDRTSIEFMLDSYSGVFEDTLRNKTVRNIARNVLSLFGRDTEYLVNGLMDELLDSINQVVQEKTEADYELFAKKQEIIDLRKEGRQVKNEYINLQKSKKYTIDLKGELDTLIKYKENGDVGEMPAFSNLETRMLSMNMDQLYSEQLELEKVLYNANGKETNLENQLSRLVLKRKRDDRVIENYQLVCEGIEDATDRIPQIGPSKNLDDIDRVVNLHIEKSNKALAKLFGVLYSNGVSQQPIMNIDYSLPSSVIGAMETMDSNAKLAYEQTAKIQEGNHTLFEEGLTMF
jgi:hypothetical protein